MDENRLTLLCEDTAEGIFSAIYYAYEIKRNPNTTVISASPIDNYSLFTEYMRVEADLEKAKKVQNTTNYLYKTFACAFKMLAV